MNSIRRPSVLVLFVILASAAVAASPAPPERGPAHARSGRASTRASITHQAAQALFEKSDLDGARALAETALRQNAADIEALFVQMEAAALQADTATELESALRLCELRRANHDARVTIAAARILDRAANSTEFRASLPRLQKLIDSGGQTNYLRAALLAAAADGAPGPSLPELARQSGLITDWRVAGPFGRNANVAFERTWPPERDGLSLPAYDGHFVESFRFDDGNFALPDYFSTAGIFYAAAEVTIPAAGEWRVRVESGGTLQVFVDGVSVLEKDGRFREQPEVAWRPVELSSGVHRVLLKLLPAAAPLRVAFLPPVAGKATARTEIAYEPEAGYVRAAERYWAGDYASAIAQLAEMRQRNDAAVVDFLLAQAWAHSAPDPPEEIALLKATLASAPAALAAEYELAAQAYDDEHAEEALRRAQRVVAARPQFAPAQHLVAQAAVRLNWPAKAAQAWEADIRLHASCGALRSAAKFFSGIGAYDRAAQIEAQLDGCAPGSLAHAEALSDAGRHAGSAAALANIVAARPLDREARALLVRELALAGKADAARQAAEQLVKLAPNAARFRHLAHDSMFDEPSPRGRALLSDRQFYAPYRRDGFRIVQQTAKRRFTGGPSVILLHDRVVRVAEDGGVSLYVHKITRVLDRDGIEKHGEVTLPRAADLLELRTIKADGGFAEPEFTQHKSSISMPALAPGDAIEEEYVIHYSDVAAAQRTNALQFTFGSFTAPLLYARFVALTPAMAELAQVKESAGSPHPITHTEDGTRVRVWEKENMTQSLEEASAPERDLLPTVRMVAVRAPGWDELRDFYRDELISALRAGPRVIETAAQFLSPTAPRTSAGAASPKPSREEMVRAMFRWVTAKIRSTESSFATGDVASVESTLANFSGSRTAVLIGLAQAAGIDARLLLGREVSSERSPGAYTRPLVLFRIVEPNGSRKEIVVDAEKDAVGFGALPPALAREDALLVPWRLEEANAAVAASMVKLPAVSTDEQSVADGDVWLDAQGNLSALVQIRMGSSRATQMRLILSAIEPGERKHFFEQLAMRIFPGAAETTGAVRNELDPDQPLEVLLNCRAPHFVNLNANAADIDQLVPALGLRKKYLGVDPRHFPLYIDTLLLETASFRLHLPDGVRVKARAAGLDVRTQFGSYSVEFRQLAPDQIEIRRAFQIPVQVISPEQFADFSRFARQIDDAERQRLTLGRL